MAGCGVWLTSKRQAALQHYLLISALNRQQLDVELLEVLALRPASASLSTQLAADWCSLQTQVSPDPASQTLYGANAGLTNETSQHITRRPLGPRQLCMVVRRPQQNRKEENDMDWLHA